MGVGLLLLVNIICCISEMKRRNTDIREEHEDRRGTWDIWNGYVGICGMLLEILHDRRE